MYAEPYYDCNDVCLNDADGDGVCDELEILGCTDPMALNYSEVATDDDESCLFCALSASVDVTHVSCAEAADGEVSVSATGAMPDSSEVMFTLLPLNVQQADSVFTGLSGGFYEVVVADEMGCADTVSFEVSEPEPLVVLLDEVVGSPENGAAGSIAISVSGGTEPYTFAWIELDGTFTSAEEDLAGLNPGTYQVEVTDANGCSVQSFEIVVETIVGVTEFGDAWTFHVYPNPATDWINVEVSAQHVPLTVELFDIAGRIVWQQTDGSIGQPLKVPVLQLAKGQYIIRVSDGTLVRQEKVLVNR